MRGGCQERNEVSAGAVTRSHISVLQLLRFFQSFGTPGHDKSGIGYLM